MQENSSGNPGTRAWFYDSSEALYGNFSEARFRFTEFTGMAFDGYTLYVGGNWVDFEISHSFLRALSFSITCDGGAGVYGLTNNVFETTDMFFTPGEWSSSVIHLRNNLYRNDAQVRHLTIPGGRIRRRAPFESRATGHRARACRAGI